VGLIAADKRYGGPGAVNRDRIVQVALEIKSETFLYPTPECHDHVFRALFATLTENLPILDSEVICRGHVIVILPQMYSLRF
jgi:hypothetical protein